jgi:hypothetical protein
MGSNPGRAKKLFSSRKIQAGSGSPFILSVNGYREFFIRLKRTEQEAVHSPPPSAKVKNEWSYTSSPFIRICLQEADRNVLFSVFARTRFIVLKPPTNFVRLCGYPQFRSQMSVISVQPGTSHTLQWRQNTQLSGCNPQSTPQCKSENNRKYT